MKTLLLLFVWLAVGIGFRFLNLGDKTPASIEIATLGFSLGHGFFNLPIDRVINLQQLLAPLSFDPTTNHNDTIRYLMSESTHPPIYFLLTQWWLKLFTPQNEQQLLWLGRSLSAIFGVVSIPAIFGLSWLAFRSRIAAHFAAAIMAVSPYGIYIAQEARHYTLTVLWIIASLSCLVIALHRLDRRHSISLWFVCIWIVVNSLGIATHYFFVIALAAEGLVLGIFWLKDFWQEKENKTFVNCLFLMINLSGWRKIYLVAIGTSIGYLVWLPYLQTISSNEITDWIDTSYDLGEIFLPIPRFLAWQISMFLLLPIEGINKIFAITSILLLLIVSFASIPMMIGNLIVQLKLPKSSLSLRIFGIFLFNSIALFLIIIYGLGKDLSLAARYHFVYFPAVIILVSLSLASCWQNREQLELNSRSNKTKWLSLIFFDRPKLMTIAILVIGILGALTVVNNYGFQKSKRSDLLVNYIQNTSKVPVLIATTYKTHSEIRELISIGFEFDRTNIDNSALSPQFMLVQGDRDGSKKIVPNLINAIDNMIKPFDLWAVNLKINREEIEALNCLKDSRKYRIQGYKTYLFHCQENI